MPIKPKTFWATGLIPLISQFMLRELLLQFSIRTAFIQPTLRPRLGSFARDNRAARRAQARRFAHRCIGLQNICFIVARLWKIVLCSCCEFVLSFALQLVKWYHSESFSAYRTRGFVKLGVSREVSRDLGDLIRR